MLRLQVKAEYPNPRLISQVVQVLKSGGIVVYPTDTTYGLGCDIYSKKSIDRIYQLKGLDKKHRLSFICDDLSQIANFAVVEDRNYRILRHHTPGPYTFVLPATREVPKLLQSNRRTIGLRIPNSLVTRALVTELGHPIISTTVTRSHDPEPMNDPDEIAKVFGRSVDAMLDAGPLYGDPSSVVELIEDEPVILRRGAGDLSWLED